jgi:hypothetical protein
MADDGKIERGYKVTILDIKSGKMICEMSVEDEAAATVTDLIQTVIEAHRKKVRRSRMKLEE